MSKYIYNSFSIDEFLENISPDFSRKDASSPSTIDVRVNSSQIVPAPLEAYSYRSRVSPGQRTLLTLLLAALGIAVLLAPGASATVIATVLLLVFSTSILLRSILIIAGFTGRFLLPRDRISFKKAETHPTFSVLIAAYREAEMMEQLAQALSKLSWPADKIEFLLLLEVDDPETYKAAKAASLPPNTSLIRVPPGGPKTKPNALNFGLSLSRGDIVTVYDAEDQPHPAQLRAVHNALRHAPDRTVCVQAPLVARNVDQNWISAQWALEYAVHFGLLVPGSSTYRMPIPLGGTSNHIRRDALLALGGWDAWNVTEDADLGMRMARAGLLTTSIRTPTFETAPATFNIWCMQRRRWLKGFLQTWLVLMRNPVQTLRQMGLARFMYVQIVLGGTILTSLAYAPVAALVIAAYFSRQLEIGAAGLALLFSGLTLGLMSDLLAPGRWSWMRVLATVTRPLYWPLHSIAAYSAVRELATRPFFWAKTPHQPSDAEPQSFYSTGS